MQNLVKRAGKTEETILMVFTTLYTTYVKRLLFNYSTYNT